jgi:hypothetical protein
MMRKLINHFTKLDVSGTSIFPQITTIKDYSKVLRLLLHRIGAMCIEVIGEQFKVEA